MIYAFIKTSVTYDGLEHMILTQDESDLKAYSLPLDQFTDELTNWISHTFNGTMVSKALDLFCLRINDERRLGELKQFLQKWYALGQFGVYCGISNTISEAYKALVFAEVNKLRSIMPYSAEVEEFLEKRLQDQVEKLGKSEKLDKMALKDISVPEPSNFRNIPQSYDYSHLLPSEFQGSHKLIINHEPSHDPKFMGTLEASIHRVGESGGWERFGKVEATHDPGDKVVNIDYSRLGENDEERLPYKGKGVGRAMYEAVLAHSANKLQATHISGGVHSSNASRVHSTLSKKHGLGYKPTLSYQDQAPKQGDGAGAFDDKYDDYKYKIK